MTEEINNSHVQKEELIQAILKTRGQYVYEDIQKIVDQIDGETAIGELDGAMALTTINVDDEKMKQAQKRIENLERTFEKFAEDKKISQQVNEWLESQDAEAKIKRAQNATEDFLRQLDEKNGIQQWAQKHKIEQRAQKVHDIIRSGVEVTQNLEINDVAP